MIMPDPHNLFSDFVVWWNDQLSREVMLARWVHLLGYLIGQVGVSSSHSLSHSLFVALGLYCYDLDSSFSFYLIISDSLPLTHTVEQYFSHFSCDSHLLVFLCFRYISVTTRQQPHSGKTSS